MPITFTHAYRQYCLANVIEIQSRRTNAYIMRHATISPRTKRRDVPSTLALTAFHFCYTNSDVLNITMVHFWCGKLSKLS